MRTDVKIGIAVGALVIVLAVVFVVVNHKRAPQAETPVVSNDNARAPRPEPLFGPARGPLANNTPSPAAGAPAVTAPSHSAEPAWLGVEAPSTRPASPQVDYSGLVWPRLADSPALETAVRPLSAPVVDRAPGPASTEIYAVKSGDTLSSIAQQRYDDPNRYQLLIDANPGIDPNNLRIGQKIKIPPAPVASPATPTAGRIAPAAPAGGGTYAIKRGDTFTSIAEDKLGSARHVNLIIAANPGVDPNRLRIGQTIVVPARPAPTTRPSGSAVASRGTASGSGARDPRRPYFANR